MGLTEDRIEVLPENDGPTKRSALPVEVLRLRASNTAAHDVR